MIKILEKYSKIIRKYQILKFEQFGENLRFRARIEFINNTVLFVRETVINGKQRKYAFHWQDRERNLIIRWDNAPDWEVKTSPHHKHVKNKIEPSYERTLEKVLEFISSKMKDKNYEIGK